MPLDTPLTVPDDDPTVAIAVLLLVQTPPVGDEDNVVVDPVHTESVPDIAEGAVFTVTALVAKQPVLNV